MIVSMDKKVLQEFVPYLTVQIGEPNMVCALCKDKVSTHNFGGYKKGLGVFCNSVICLFDYTEVEKL